MSNVDRDLQVPVKLNAWATNISQPYLAYHDPTTLHKTDTIGFSWKEMQFFKKDEMDIDDVQEWIPVPSRRCRSRSPPSPPKQQNPISKKTSKFVGSFAPVFNLSPAELPENYRPMENTPTDQVHSPTLKNNHDLIDRK